MNIKILLFQKLIIKINLSTKSGEAARNYLKQRNFSNECIKEFEFGLASNNNSLYNFLHKKGYSDSDIERTSLISTERNIHDIFINRVMIPIHDLEGNIVGFTGRIYTESNDPKYINSKESDVFKKGKILFNYHRAKVHVRNSRELIIVEGNKANQENYNDEEIIKLVNELVAKGLSKKDAIEFVSNVTKVRKNHIKDII